MQSRRHFHGHFLPPALQAAMQAHAGGMSATLPPAKPAALHPD